MFCHASKLFFEGGWLWDPAPVPLHLKGEESFPPSPRLSATFRMVIEGMALAFLVTGL